MIIVSVAAVPGSAAGGTCVLRTAVGTSALAPCRAYKDDDVIHTTACVLPEVFFSRVRRQEPVGAGRVMTLVQRGTSKPGS